MYTGQKNFKTVKKLLHTSARPESLEVYIKKGALLGQKAALNLWYVNTRPYSQKMFPSIWLMIFLNKIFLVIFFIHIIQLSLFSS